ASGSATSARTKRPPISSATRVPPSLSRSTTTTEAPRPVKALAVASPSPEPPPVTMALLPWSSMFCPHPLWLAYTWWKGSSPAVGCGARGGRPVRRDAVTGGVGGDDPDLAPGLVVQRPGRARLSGSVVF